VTFVARGKISSVGAFSATDYDPNTHSLGCKDKIIIIVGLSSSSPPLSSPSSSLSLSSSSSDVRGGGKDLLGGRLLGHRLRCQHAFGEPALVDPGRTLIRALRFYQRCSGTNSGVRSSDSDITIILVLLLTSAAGVPQVSTQGWGTRNFSVANANDGGVYLRETRGDSGAVCSFNLTVIDGTVLGVKASRKAVRRRSLRASLV
jgi:hypothetical protein